MPKSHFTSTTLFSHLNYESLQNQNISLLLHAQKNILTPGPADQSLQRNVLITNGQHLFLSTQLASPRKGPGICILNHFILLFWGTFMCITNYNISKRLKQSSGNGDETDAFFEGHREIKLEPSWKFPPWWLALILPEDVHSAERELSYASGTLHVAIPISPVRWPHWCKDSKVWQGVTICFLIGLDAHIHICNCKPNQKPMSKHGWKPLVQELLMLSSSF